MPCPLEVVRKCSSWFGAQLCSQSAVHVLRVNQLDAGRLDDEISELLRQHVADIFDFWSTPLVQRFQPELQAILRAIVWKYTIWEDSPTPGGRLQNLIFVPAASAGVTPLPLMRNQKLGFLVVTAFLPWLSIRLHEFAEHLQSVGQRSNTWLQGFARWCTRFVAPWLTRAHAVCTTINFIAFLHRGTFVSLSQRALGIRMMHIESAARRQTSLEYMNRVLVWNGVSEFLTTVLPLLDLTRVQRYATRRLLPRGRAGLDVGASDVKGSVCGFCGASPAGSPVRSDCGHQFCYFCLASELMEGVTNGGVACPTCSSTIVGFKHAF